MRQLSMKLALAFAIMLPIFYGCKNDDDGPDLIPPTIEATSGDPTTVEVGATADITYTVTTPGGFANATVAPNDASIATATVSRQGTVGQQTTTITVTVTGVAAGQTNVTLTVQDQQDQQATDDVAVTVNAVDTPDPELPPTAGIALDTIADLSTLNAAVDALDLNDTLNNADRVTIFAPNNAAFTNLLTEFSLEDGDLDGLIAALTADSVSSVLQAHIVADSLGKAELTDGLELTTLNDKTITIANDGTNVFVNGAQVVDSDILVGNGVIHVIDSVINLTEDEETGGGIDVTTVADTIASLGDLNSLEAALTTAELVDDLQGDGPFTVFAPNNAAFAELLAAEGVADLTALVDKIGGPALTSILQAHVIADSLPADLLEAQAYATLNQDATLTVTMAGDSVFVNGAGVLTTNILASNGVVHIIDSVVNLPMAPPPGAAATVVDTIASRDELEALEAALTATNLIEPLQGEGKFTVFAPNNDAFTTLFQNNGVTSLEELIAKLGESAVMQILQAHVVSNAEVFTSDKLNDQRVFESMDGATLTITVQGGETYVNGALISEKDLTTGNGVVHIIDEVVNTTAGNTGANGFTVTIENVSSGRRYFQNGVFNTPVEASDAGPAGPGEAFTFSFHAGPVLTTGDSTRLSFAAMLTGSFDRFLGFGENGMVLYKANVPVTGDISDQLMVYDAGTEDDAGVDETGSNPVTLVGPATSFATASIAHDGGTLFTVTITNAQTDDSDPDTNEGISPGVYGVHTVNTPIFKVSDGGNSASYPGLEALAETGDPTQLNTTMSNDEGFAVPLSPGVYAVDVSDNTFPILREGQAAPGNGLEVLAEDGDPSALATFLSTSPPAGVKASGVFNTPVGATEARAINPGESYSFQLTDVVAGDYLSIVTMMVQSNDIVYSTFDEGIPLFDGDGNPVNGNITGSMVAYDVGTEVNEYPGAGLNQPIRGTGGTVENGTVEVVTTNDVDPSDDGFIYRPVNQRIRVTITPNAAPE